MFLLFLSSIILQVYLFELKQKCLQNTLHFKYFIFLKKKVLHTLRIDAMTAPWIIVGFKRKIHKIMR